MSEAVLSEKLREAVRSIRTLRGKVDALQAERDPPIAVIGLGCRLPGAEDADALWRLLAVGGDAVGPVPPDRWDNARWYDLSGQLLAVLLHGEETGGGLAAVEITETYGKHPPRHVHHRHDELVYVLEGEFTFEVAGRRQPAPTGTLVFIPRGTDHGFAVESASGRILVVITPAGLEEGFLEASHPAWSLDPATRPEPATYEHLLGLVEKYDSEVTGPPIDPRF